MIGILEAIDMNSYRVEKQAALRIALAAGEPKLDGVRPHGVGRTGRRSLRPSAELKLGRYGKRSILLR